MSKINIKKLSAVLAVLLLAGLVLAGAGAAEDTASIGIQVVDSADNQTPIEGAGIVVTGNGITTPITGVTNSSGFWSYDGLSTSVEYVVTVRNDGYYDSTTIIYGGQNNVVSLTRSIQEVVNAYYYVTGYNDTILTPGYVYVDANGNSFNVPSETVEDWYLTPEGAPTGTYYHLIGTGLFEYDQIVYVSPAKLSYHKISESTIYTDAGLTPKTTEIYIEEANEMYPYLIFENADAEGVFVDGNDIVTVDARNKFTVTANVNYKGTWNVYADFSKTVNEDLSVSANANLYKKTPAEYKYVQIGTFKILENKSETVSATLSSDIVDLGSTVLLTVKGPANSGIHLSYYANDGVETYENDSEPVQMEGGDTPLVILNNQSCIVGGVAMTDRNGNASVYLKASSATKDAKLYILAVWVDGCVYPTVGSQDVPCKLQITLKSYNYTAELAKKTFTLGDNIKLTGTYDEYVENFKLYSYLEGANVPFFALTEYAKKYTISGKQVDDYEVADGNYYYNYDKSQFQDFNPGTYTLYVSTLPNIFDGEEKITDFTTEQKMLIIGSSKVLTLVLLQPTIQIEYSTPEVERGFNQTTGDGNYIATYVEAPGTDSIAVYIIGENKMFHIGGENGEAVDSRYIKTLSRGDTEHYLFSTDASNLYAYPGIDTDKSVEKIAAKLGSGTYPLYLIVDNEDGTFMVFVHIQEPGEAAGRISTYPDEEKNNTEFALGQYYLTVQHPMQDRFYNTWATTDTSGTGYQTGTNVYTNELFRFNVPAAQSKTAINNLIMCIGDGNDAQSSTTFYCVAEVSDDPYVSGVEASYTRGETITIVVSGGNLEEVSGTLESSTFDFTAENLNYIQSFAVEWRGIGDVSIYTLTLDTTQVPLGDYNIVLRDGSNAFKVYETKIVSGPYDPGTVVINGPSAIKVSEVTTLTAKMTDGSVGNFSWTSSDSSVASVDGNGNVWGVKAGSATITATDANTGESASISISVYINGSGFQQISSELSATGLVVPEQTVTAKVVFSFNIKNLAVGDTITVQTSFSTPWEATIDVVGDELSYSDTVTNKRPSMDCINILNISSNARVTVTCTGLVPETAAGATIVPLTVVVKSANSSESGTAQTDSVQVYNTKQLTSDISKLSSAINTQSERINTYSTDGLSVTVPQGYLTKAQYFLSHAQMAGVSDYTAAKYVIEGFNQISLAETSLNEIVLAEIGTKLTESNDIIQQLKAKKINVETYEALYTAYNLTYSTYTSSTEYAKVDELYQNVKTLYNDVYKRLHDFPVEYPETLNLREGWNFISVPMTLDSSMDTAGEFFEEVDMDNHSVLGYDSCTKSWKQLTASTVLKPLDAYWVYSKEDFVGTKTIVFDTQSPSVGNTKEIYKGWNAVGLNIDVTDGTYFLSAKSTFAGLDWNRYFEKYTTGAWKTIVNGGSSSESEEKYIYAGAGGWIYANEDGILIGNAS